MTARLVLRNGESISGDMLARILGYEATGVSAPSNVGTGFSSGIIGGLTQFACSTVSGLNVQTSAGWAVVISDTGASSFDPKALLASSDAALTATAPANSSGTSRTDTLCLRIATDTSGPAPDATGSNCPTLFIVTGGASNALGNAPGDGALYLPLANAVLANAGASYSSFTRLTNNYFPGIPAQIPFAAAMYDSVAQAIPSATFTTVQYNTVDYDPSSSLTTGGSAKFTAQVAGRYIFTVCNQFATSALVARYILVYLKNGATVRVAFDFVAAASAGFNAPSNACQIALAAGDTVQVQVFQGTGGSLSINGGLSTARLDVHLLSRL